MKKAVTIGPRPFRARIVQLVRQERTGAIADGSALALAGSDQATHHWHEERTVAGCGLDAAPYYRVFNPTTQAEKFDPDGSYIRRWVPELRDLPLEHLHEP